jgi:nucleotidyltransferase substrate binding protein (TIGR01987 family)
VSISIINLEKALATLLDSVNAYDNEVDKYTREFIKDSCIKRFEYTYSVALAYIFKFAEENSVRFQKSDVKIAIFAIKCAAERGVIDNPLIWESFRSSRNKTSHEYDEVSSDAVLAVIPDFIKEVQFLIERVRSAS